MTTETQTVKRMVAAMKSGKIRLDRWTVRHLLLQGDVESPFKLFSYEAGRRNDSKRLHRRIAKKLRQPFRRKNRGPLRAKAAGKNEVHRIGAR